MAPRYTSETQIAITSKRTNPFPETEGQRDGADTIAPRLDREAINTHVKALGAPSLLAEGDRRTSACQEGRIQCGRRSGRYPRPVDAYGRHGQGKPECARSGPVLEAVKDRLQVSAARESRFISIKFSATEPQLAADFANKLAEAYRRSLVDVPVQETNDVVQALLPKIEQLNGEVAASEAELERFRAKTDRLLTGPQLVPMNSQRLSALSEELSRAEAERSQSEARWRTAQELLRAGNAEVLPEAQSSNVIQGLINQRVRLERQVNEASASLLPAHPRMRQLNADLAGLKRSITSEVSKIVQGLEKSYKTTQIRVNDIARQVSDLKAKVVDTSGDDAQVKVLEARAKSKRAELERLQRQLEDNKTLVVTKTVPIEAQIISAARASGVPSFPKKGPISALVAAAMFLLGLALTAAREIIMRGQGAVIRPEDRLVREPERVAQPEPSRVVRCRRC